MLLCVEVCCSVFQCVAKFYLVMGVRSVSQMLQPLIPFVVGTVPQGLIYMWYRSQTQEETQIPQYKSKLKKNINLNLYRNVPSNSSFSIGGFWGCYIFSGNYHTDQTQQEPSNNNTCVSASGALHQVSFVLGTVPIGGVRSTGLR